MAWKEAKIFLYDKVVWGFSVHYDKGCVSTQDTHPFCLERRFVGERTGKRLCVCALLVEMARMGYLFSVFVRMPLLSTM